MTETTGKPANQGTPQEQGARILIIDDNREIHEDLRKVLSTEPVNLSRLKLAAASLFGEAPAAAKARGFQISSAYQGQEGHGLVREALAEGKPYTLAFVDVRMPPGWDGIETVTRLWEVDPNLEIVLCTAYSDYSWEEMLSKLGMTERFVILKKPFENIEVLQLAHALSEKWRLRRQARTEKDRLEVAVEERTRDLLAATERIRSEMAERVQAEDALRQMQKMEAVGQLAGGIAHDFNNLLTIIQGYTGVLRLNAELAPKVQEQLAQIEGATFRAIHLTRQLLTFSRKQVMQPEVLDLNELVQQFTAMLRRTLGETIALQNVAAEGLPSFRGDRAMVEQVLLNLAVNARDAMPAGGCLTIGTQLVTWTEAEAAGLPQARPGRFLRLSVSDDGCGIRPEVLPRIFEPFFTTKPAGQGTGLGLATVFGIVRQHDGWIAVNSSPESGTTFHAYFPASDQTAAVVSLLRPAPSPPPCGRETVLLVEDEAELREFTRTFLGQLGYRVHEAGSGPEALAVWGRHCGEIDLLLTDLVMPEGVTGCELARRLISDNKCLRVILTSGYSMELDKLNGRIPTGMSFLPKPYTLDGLARMIRSRLDTPTAGPATRAA